MADAVAGAGGEPASPQRGRGGPFAAVRLPAALAASGMLAAGTWTVLGGVLPGSRWVPVHLFTLAVLTPAIVGFTHHFAAALLMTASPARPPTPLLAVGVVATLIGVGASVTWLAGVGPTVLTVAVLVSYVRLRRQRKAAVQPRWVWMVRAWERAHGAFTHGAILGILLATGALRGSWIATARLSHLHVNLLGWGGVTLLATSCMFGPMALRAQMLPDAPDIAARWSRRAATGVTVGVLALLASALGGTPGLVLRLVAAAGIGVFSAAAAAVARPLVAAVRHAPHAQWPGLAIVGAVCLLAVTAALDAVVIATGRWAYLDALGVLMIAGVLLCAIVGALATVAPWLLTRSRPGRDTVRAAIERAWPVPVALWGGAALAATGAAWRTLAARAVVVRTGWGLVIGAVAMLVARLAWARLHVRE